LVDPLKMFGGMQSGLEKIALQVGSFCRSMDRLSKIVGLAMACPKKKTSNGKRDQRRAHWKKQAAREADKALSLGKSILTGRAKGFVYPTADEGEE
jgi:large subunit ribosomal protein L32